MYHVWRRTMRLRIRNLPPPCCNYAKISIGAKRWFPRWNNQGAYGVTLSLQKFSGRQNTENLKLSQIQRINKLQFVCLLKK